MLATAETAVSQNYRKALETVRLLSVREQLALIAEVAVQLRQQMAAEPRRRSILELRGLGKEIWSKINIDEYLRQERSSWD
jgi:hypothetical protein